MHCRVFALLMILTSIAGMLLIIPNTNSASACECKPWGTPAEELERTQAVFSGKVTDIQKSSSADYYEVKFDLERSWKGVSGKTVTVFTSLDSGGCGFEFQMNEKYLVYAFGSQGSFWTSFCGRTTSLANAQEDLKVLNAWLSVYLLSVDDQVFRIPHRVINGHLKSLEADPDFNSMIVSIESEKEGTFEITLPRNLIDAKSHVGQEEFIVLVNGEEGTHQEAYRTPCFRTLLIDFPKNSEEIEIIANGVGQFPVRQVSTVAPVYILTDDNNYKYGDVITLQACTSLALYDERMVIEVLNPEGKIYKKMSVTLILDGSYSTDLPLKGELATNGTYAIKATYAGETATSNFVVPEFPVNLMIIAAIALTGSVIALRTKRF